MSRAHGAAPRGSARCCPRCHIPRGSRRVPVPDPIMVTHGTSPAKQSRLGRFLLCRRGRLLQQAWKLCLSRRAMPAVTHNAWFCPEGAAGKGVGCIQLPKIPLVPWRPLPGRCMLTLWVPKAAPHQPLMLQGPVPLPNLLWGSVFVLNLKLCNTRPPSPVPKPPRAGCPG